MNKNAAEDVNHLFLHCAMAYTVYNLEYVQSWMDNAT